MRVSNLMIATANPTLKSETVLPKSTRDSDKACIDQQSKHHVWWGHWSVDRYCCRLTSWTVCVTLWITPDKAPRLAVLSLFAQFREPQRKRGACYLAFIKVNRLNYEATLLYFMIPAIEVNFVGTLTLKWHDELLYTFLALAQIFQTVEITARSPSPPLRLRVSWIFRGIDLILI